MSRMTSSGSLMSFEVEGKTTPSDTSQRTMHAKAKYASVDEARAAEREREARAERSQNRCSHLYERGENPRQTIFMLLDEPESGLLATIISFVVLLLIIASSTCFIMESMASVQEHERAVKMMHVVETACILVFTIEYLARVFTCSQRPRENQSVWRYLTKPMSLIDLVSIAPFYIELLLGGKESGLAVVRMLRMSRLFRILKVGTYAENLQLFAQGMQRSGEGLMVLSFLLALYLVVFAAVLYELERDAQRDPEYMPGVTGPDRSGFESIPTTWYFIMATMTTVGYGDHYPVTPAGKIVAAVCMLCGIFVLGLPIVIIGNSFEEVFEQEEELKAEIKRKIRAKNTRFTTAGSDETTDNPLDNTLDGRDPVPEEASLQEAEQQFNTAISILSLCEVLDDLYEQTGDNRFHKAWTELSKEPDE